ncbi:conserved hypothetical protein [Neospora caninum Liverpool]|uniref:Pantoate-beta-alanine ligase n=1 Tax=Neospora caninum (strain Liverpool) TaxID=572307 RepID=F0VM89_NEOCL|nr:conserved hypothetical protein [Neospora caninum Liverpool]CBZ54367.1 conserved hypothetical protein [Neospora caninum Liverpool]CEL69073.1 TPA: pantoate-beta-alanine ligase [Neospora caninum Liverpool]|eukprot:XP_003884397.1 conserved hypothetical protein [Neospora caninum Liverpool]
MLWTKAASTRLPIRFLCASLQPKRLADLDAFRVGEPGTNMLHAWTFLLQVGEIFRKGERRVHALLEAARAFAEKEKLLLHYTTIDRLEDGEPVVYRHTSGAVKRLGACCGEEETAERRAKRRREGEKADGAEDGTEGGPPAAGCHVDRHEVSLNGTRAAPSSKGTDFDMSLLDSGRYCLTVAVRGNPLTTVVDSVFLVPSNRDDLLPPPFNTPWDHHCVEPKYACLPSFVLFSSFGFHLRRLRPADVRVIAAAEAEDAQLERGHLKSPASSAEGVCCAPSFAWMNERALAKTSTQDVWALGVFKRRLGTSRNTVDESDPAVPEGNEALVGYAWADAETPPDATAPGASPAPWRLRRVFITRVRRRRTFGTHLVKAFLATLYKEKVSRSPTASREVVGDPMPAWFAPVARECGFSLMEATALTSGMCRMRLNLDHWFRVFVTELDL